MSQVLLLVDVMSRFDFPEGPALLRQLVRKLPAILRLRRRFSDAGLAVVFANDNAGRWRSDFAAQVRRCTRSDAPGVKFARALVPEPDDYFVLKPHLSAFFGSPLQDLLGELKCSRIVIAGMATDACVLATAIDAHMRKFTVHVPHDCVAAPTAERSRRALAVLQQALEAATSGSRSIVLKR